MWLARRDHMPLDADVLHQLQDRHTGQPSVYHDAFDGHFQRHAASMLPSLLSQARP